MPGAGRSQQVYCGPMASSRSERTDHTASYCPFFHRTVEVIGRRWSGVILLAMHTGLERFTDIRDQIPGLSDRLLTQRLRELESEGLIERSEDHGKVRYRLSKAGRELSPVIEAIENWTSRWAKSI